ncbi:hypothetical protein [Paludisphaera rhizosphaerae]|uniref:hypothetical protein n=1 Tax=Paludisphaera rhizosphaerae TaxID=2711216 RepID=UPI0013EA0F2D|nr:hypothetical protein [Paludisphaera rhizosphaerae]
MSWMLVRRSLVTALGLVLTASTTGAQDAKKSDDAGPKLRIEQPVVCSRIDGFENYEELPNAELTADEKLLVYFRPRDYKVVPKGDQFAARFTEDAQIRAAGSKKVLRRKDDILEYEGVAKKPPRSVYLSNTFALKGLPPGDYEYDVILRDENDDKKTELTATVKFRIVTAKLPKSAE